MRKRALLALPLLAGLAACGTPMDPMASLAQGTAAYAPPAQRSAAAPARRCDTAFRVVNQSGMTVERLFFSHASRGNWGADQLGSNVLPPGRSASYRASYSGAYDFRVVFADGRAAELRGVNICAASNVIVTNRGLRAT
jgi:hypothetical protein